MQGSGKESVPFQRAKQRADVALAIAEDDRVGEVRLALGDAPERRPLVGWRAT